MYPNPNPNPSVRDLHGVALLVEHDVEPVFNVALCVHVAHELEFIVADHVRDDGLVLLVVGHMVQRVEHLEARENTRKKIKKEKG